MIQIAKCCTIDFYPSRFASFYWESRQKLEPSIVPFQWHAISCVLYPSKIFAKLDNFYQPQNDVRNVSLKITSRVHHPEVNWDASLFRRLLHFIFLLLIGWIFCRFSFHHGANSFSLQSPWIETSKKRIYLWLYNLHLYLLKSISWKHPCRGPVTKMKEQPGTLDILWRRNCYPHQTIRRHWD